MSSISGISSATSAGSQMHVSRGHRHEKAFEKTDTDGNGSVDSTELQSMLDDISQKTGDTLGSADDLMKSMDTDGNGSLSSAEFDKGMKSLMPAPSSTVQFAQQRGGEGGAGGCGMPPPPDGASGSDDLMQTLMSIGDSNQDGTLSTDEAQTLNDKLTAALDSALSSMTSTTSSTSGTNSTSASSSSSNSSSDSSSSSSSGSGTSDTDALQQAAAQLAERMTAMLMHRYGAADAANGSESSLSIAA